MKYISELREILDEELPWHKSQLDCFAQMLLALFTVRLSKIAVSMHGGTLIESRYNRVKSQHSYFLILHLINSTYSACKHTCLDSLFIWLVVSRDELMIVVTNKHPKNAIACYLRRWEIETLFCALKSRG